MAYQPYDRNPSGIVFFGTSATDQVFESNANFTFGAGVLRVPNVTLDDDGELGSATTPNAVTIASDGTVTIAGDLTVNGTTTTVNSTTVEIADNILLLNKGVTGSPTLDAGLEIERGDSTNVLMIWDEGIDKWTFTNDGSTYYSMWTGLTVGGDVNADESIIEGETLTLNGGSGITTSMSTNAVTFDVDATVISGQTLITSADSGDHILILDATDGVLKKITKGNFISDLGGGTVTSVAIAGTDGIDVDSGSPITGAGTITLGLSNIANDKLANSSISLAGDSGSPETVDLGETLTIAGGAGVSTTISATNTATVDVNVDDSTIEVSADALQVKDGGITNAKLADGSVDGDTIAFTVDSTFANNDTIASDINLVTTGASNITIKLPAPSAGKIVRVKKVDSAAGQVIIAQNSAETVDGASSKTLYYQYESMTFVSDGTNWFVF